MIWWIWTAFDPREVHIMSIHNLWNCEDDYGPYEDVAWLGDGAWVFRFDNMNFGLR